MENPTNSNKSNARGVLRDGDYGFYGKGFSGYSHYMQAFNGGGGGGGGCLGGCGTRVFVIVGLICTALTALHFLGVFIAWAIRSVFG